MTSVSFPPLWESEWNIKTDSRQIHNRKETVNVNSKIDEQQKVDKKINKKLRKTEGMKDRDADED